MATDLAVTLSRNWSRRGLLAIVLWPVSLLFGALAALRRGLYRTGLFKSTRLPVPLIIVGNIFVGGTGKTPFTIWLIAAMRTAGFTPGVISRGYGSRDEGAREVTNASRAAEVGDEPLLIVHRTGAPLMVGRDRAAAAQALLAAHPEVNLIISDDGLQHYALARDIEIVLFDDRGAGNGWLLPAGPLREPRSRRRDFTVYNALALPPGAVKNDFVMRLDGQFAERLQDSTMRLALQDLPRERLFAAAGIGNPARFFSMLERAGLTFTALPLPDHFAYTENPFALLAADIILITEKDAVKCRQHQAIQNDPRIWVVPVAAQLDVLLAQHLVEKLRGYPTA